MAPPPVPATSWSPGTNPTPQDLRSPAFNPWTFEDFGPPRTSTEHFNFSLNFFMGSQPIEQSLEMTNWNEQGSQQMVPPEINVEFAPASRMNSFEQTSLDTDDLTPPPPRRRNRARSSPPTNRRRQSTSSVPNRDYILGLADPQYQAAPDNGNAKRVQKHSATFQCTLCPRTFTRAYNLRSHMKTHDSNDTNSNSGASSKDVVPRSSTEIAESAAAIGVERSNSTEVSQDGMHLETPKSEEVGRGSYDSASEHLGTPSDRQRSKSRSRGKLLPPVIVKYYNGMVAKKRSRNTRAARRSTEWKRGRPVREIDNE